MGKLLPPRAKLAVRVSSKTYDVTAMARGWEVHRWGGWVAPSTSSLRIVPLTTTFTAAPSHASTIIGGSTITPPKWIPRTMSSERTPGHFKIGH